ncbi:MAG: phosphotransferase [Terracidiphilus sp.]|jgi:Ser/Thr protein kinase RdoA (MazF antagonist)
MTDEIAMSAMAKAHGMDGTLVEPDWPPLTLAELRLLLRQFPGIGEPTRILSVSPRPLSAAGIVATRNDHGTEQRVFVKRHHRAVRDREGLLEEHRFLSHLLVHGVPVPRVLASAAGETDIAMGEWTYEVHETPQGIDLYEDAISWTPFRSSANAHSAGAALARLHLAAQSFPAPRRMPRPLVASFTIFAASDPSAAMERFLAARQSLADHKAVHACSHQALELLARFHAELVPLLPALAPLWTHNDFHASNLFWSDVGPNACVTAIIDIGLADRTNAVHDIAHAIERNIVEWLVLVNDPAHPDDVPIHFDHLQTLLDGYESVRPLSSEESAALAPMTALCHAEFALSEADYFLGILHSEEKAAMAYDGWLVGHAHWFHGAAGSALLNALRRRAARPAQGMARP